MRREETMRVNLTGFSADNPPPLLPTPKTDRDAGQGNESKLAVTRAQREVGDRVSDRRYRMKLVTVTLMFLGSLAFLGVDTARLDASSQFRKKWNKWALSHGKKELQASSSYPTGLADEKTVPTQTLVQFQDKQSTSSTPQASTQSVAHIRVKRYRQSMNHGSRSNGCRFGTCTVQKLAHQIYQFTDKDKDSVAPRNKISSQGYGRRRRRSLPEVLRARTVVSSQEQAHAAPASQEQAQPNHLQAL
ncbi:hypothetical protein STEG23_020168 [Scotinomys teguina]